MPAAESNPAAVLAFDAAVLRAQSPRLGDKPLPPSTAVNDDAAASTTEDAQAGTQGTCA